MNGTQQQTHRTVTADLQQQIADQLVIVEAIDARVLVLAKEARWVHEELGTMRLEQTELREQCERNRSNLIVAFTHENETRHALYNFQHLPFLSRLRWLLLGAA